MRLLYALLILVLSVFSYTIYSKDLKLEYYRVFDEGNVVKIYTMPGCIYCVKLENLLDRESIRYHKIDLTMDEELRRKLLAETGQNTVPYVYVADEFIGGYSDFIEFLNNNPHKTEALKGDPAEYDNKQ